MIGETSSFDDGHLAISPYWRGDLESNQIIYVFAEINPKLVIKLELTVRFELTTASLATKNSKPLSYASISNLVGMNGFEPLTSSFRDLRSNQLNYIPIKWYLMTESNRRQSRCKRGALPTELIRYIGLGGEFRNPGFWYPRPALCL